MVLRDCLRLQLYQAIPMVMNVVALVLFFFVGFSAVGLSLYHGATTRSCLDMNTTDAIQNNFKRVEHFTLGVDYSNCPTTLQCDSDNAGFCLEVPYEYTGDLPDEINSYGFDNFRNALITVFIATTLDEWPQISDPIRGAPLMAAWTAWGFFALVVLICGMLGTNLFVAVISFAFGTYKQSPPQLDYQGLSDGPLVVSGNVAESEDGTSAFVKGQVYNTLESSLKAGNGDGGDGDESPKAVDREKAPFERAASEVSSHK